MRNLSWCRHGSRLSFPGCFGRCTRGGRRRNMGGRVGKMSEIVKTWRGNQRGAGSRSDGTFMPHDLQIGFLPPPYDTVTNHIHSSRNFLSAPPSLRGSAPDTNHAHSWNFLSQRLRPL